MSYSGVAARRARAGVLTGVVLAVALCLSGPAMAAAPPATCAGVKAADPTAVDGPRILTVSGRSVEIHCADMTTASPKEYLTLPTGEAGNFAAINRNTYGAGLWTTQELRTGYEKVRIDLGTLRVDLGDRRFSRSSGGPLAPPSGGNVTSVALGSATTSSGGSSAAAPRGRGRVDLRGTPFAIASGFVKVASPVWDTVDSPSDGSATLSAADQVATLRGSSNNGGIRTAAAGELELKLLPAAAGAVPDTMVSADRVRRAIFVAGDGMRLAKNADGLRALVQERLLQELYRQQPDLDAADARAILQAVDGVMKASGPTDRTLATLTFNERVLALLAAAQLRVTPSGGFEGLGADRARALAAALPRVADRALTESDQLGQASAMFSATVDKSASLANAGFAASRILADSFELGQVNARFRAARDGQWGGGTSLADGAGKLAAAYPGLQSTSLTLVLDELAETGSVKVSVVGAVQEGAAASDSITDLMDVVVSDNEVSDEACASRAPRCTEALMQAAVQARAPKFERARARSVFTRS